VDLTIEPATPERWADVLSVFGTRGDPSRCWCVYLRHASVSYQAPARDGNRAELRSLVEAGRVPGLLAYSGGGPVGWVSAAPRSMFAERLERSPALKPVPFAGGSGGSGGSGGEVWSVLCFVVPRPHRHQGVAHALLAGSVAYARSRGAGAIEGVPRDDTGGRRWADPVAYTGTASMFAAAGFTEIDRRRDDRVVYRLEL
jgi:GNAT superfamily N-acetyltransferase